MFEELLRLSPDAVVIADSAGRIVDLNRPAEEMFGFSKGDLLGQPVEALIPNRFRHNHPTHRDNYIARSHTRPMGAGLQLYGLKKDGTEFPVDIMLSAANGPTGKVVVSVVRDVSEQRRAQEELRRRDQLFRSIVEGVKDYAIFTLDREGLVASWNSGAEQIKGYKAEEIIGQHFSRFYTQEDISRSKPGEELRIAAEKGRIEDEGWRVRKDGSRFWANVVITAIRDANGHLTGFSKITRDFTDRKRVQDALLLQLSEVLLSNVDIRKLLSAISASIQKVVPHDVGILGLHDPVTDQLRVQLLDTSNPSNADEAFIPLKDSPAGRAFAAREPLVLRDITAGDFAPETYAHLLSMGVKSACWLPLLNRDRAIGTLTIASRKESAFEKRDVEMLGKIAGQIAMAVDNALAFRQLAELKDRLREEKEYLQEELNTENSFDDIIGDSSGLKQVLKQVETVAPTEATVLIEGETGTGKELIARAVHRLSNRHDRPFIKLNCAAIPSGLLESELFGHEKGAFTGAIAQKIGRIELAAGGTLFLDEVGELPLDLQPKLLRALQEKEIERVGGTRSISVDVRLVAATNRNLRQMVADKQFRNDLFYRLHVFPLHVPALRQRRDDIPLLVRYFVDKHSRKLARNIETIPQELMDAFTKWSWPGNIRELENFIERAVILTHGKVLRAPLAELEVAEENGLGAFPAAAGASTLESAERELILRVLRETKEIGGPAGAAAKLGLKRTTLNSKLKKLGISRRDYI